MIFLDPASLMIAACGALILDRVMGDPAWLIQRMGHPVIWIGNLIGWLDQHLNKQPKTRLQGRIIGALTLFLIIIIVASTAVIFTIILATIPAGALITGVLASILLCQRSLARHVADVSSGLQHQLASGRAALSHLVGRDVSQLDESEIAKGAVESLAENTADGIIAPLFWFLIAGLPGIAIYKAINTADSMIGHHSPRHEHFGWAAARLDDLVNLPAARLTALLFMSAGYFCDARPKAAWRAVWRDANNHLSPNAGWPEAAMAGALGLRLGGPRSYAGQNVDLAFMGNGRSTLNRQDIDRALLLYQRALTLLTGTMITLGIIVLLD
jgi:adenosylcobinamide-phosphate synthase